jgi:hypothetical protein
MYTSIYSGPNFYVYLITDLNPIGTEKYYIGSSTRKELIEKNINPEEDTYFGSSTVEHFKILQKNQSPQLERIIVKTFSFKKDCLDYEEKLQREYEAASNPLFYNLSYANSFMNSVESINKGLETKRNNIDDNGLNEFNRTSLKISKHHEDVNWVNDVWKPACIQIGKSNSKYHNNPDWKSTVWVAAVDKIKSHYNDPDWIDNVKIPSTKRMIESKLNNIDEDGLNTFQRVGIKASNTKLNDIDENGLNTFQRVGVKMLNTKLNDIDENGLNACIRNTRKGNETKLNDVDVNGLNTFQRVGIKTLNTRLDDIDENGLNSFKRAGIKMLSTKLNDVDDTGLNSFERAHKKSTKTKGFRYSNICHIELGCFRTGVLMADQLPHLSPSVIIRLARTNFNQVITKLSYLRNNYLQYLGTEDDIVGLTWKDLGFYLDS